MISQWLANSMFSKLLLVMAILPMMALSRTLSVLGSTALGRDPQTVNHLNGESFQQDALVTFSGHQYAALWTPSPLNSSVRQITLSRRALNGHDTAWKTIKFTDYNQTGDDGHDMYWAIVSANRGKGANHCTLPRISLGISKGDGSIHLAFDEHDGPFHYRSSIPGVALSTSVVLWSTDSFHKISSVLPGLEDVDPATHFVNVTYPRFLSVPDTQIKKGGPDLLLEYRVGRSGLGDDWLFLYTPSAGSWSVVGKYLEGVNNNAYINGLDFDTHGTLHVTWTYRDYINDTGFDVAVQAGPNGPENNHDLVYAYSPDLGSTWYNNWNQTIASLVSGGIGANLPFTIDPTSPGVTVFSIPKYGGILNQEAQTVDWEGRVHVLNRENGTGTERWYHYWRSPVPTFASSPDWHRAILPLSIQGDPRNVTGTPTVIGKRGKLVAVPPTVPATPSDAFVDLFESAATNSSSTSSPQGATLLALLPDNSQNSTAFTILASTSARDFNDWEVVWRADEGCGWEVLFDRYRLTDSDGVLSLFMINGTEVQVWDIGLDKS